MKRIITFLALTAVIFTTPSCSKNKEADDLAKAQKCLDEVPQGGYTQAYSCLAIIKDYDSQQANILKCSIVMTSGGLMEDKIVKAFNSLKGAASNSTTAFMAVLALDQPTPAGGFLKAKEADVYCQATGVTGYQYISSIAVAGSFMNQAIAGLNGGVGIDISSPATIDAAVSSLLTGCAVPVPDPTCATDIATLGATVATLQTSYCGTPDADQDVCGQVQSAITAAAGNDAAVGQALLCYLNNKTYVPGSPGSCSP